MKNSRILNSVGRVSRPVRVRMDGPGDPSHRRRAPEFRARGGLTLFEVLISLVIFVGAMAAIGQLVSNGVRGALQSRFQTEAAMLCEAKLAEVVAGIVPLQSTQGVYPNDAHWSWTLMVTVGPVPGLMRAEVTVKRQAANAKAVVSFNMARYVRDPQLYYAAEEEAERNKQEQEESTTSK
jgi:general secretion pathway protein I